MKAKLIRPTKTTTCAACGRQRKASDLFLVPLNEALVVVCQPCLEREGQEDWTRALRAARRRAPSREMVQ